MIAATVPSSASSDDITGSLTVTIHATNNPPPLVLSPDDVQDDKDVADQHMSFQPAGTYHERTVSGMSVGRLATLAGVAPDTLQSMTITDAIVHTPVVTLSKDEVFSGFTGSPNAADTQPSYAVFGSFGGSSLSFDFLRPLSGPTDDNQRDSFNAGIGPGGGIDVTIELAGGLLTVQGLAAAPAEPKADQSVQFTIRSVTLSGAPASGLSYAWTFGDGGTATSRSPNHTYKDAGRWAARVVATDANGNAGSAQIKVQVGSSDPDREGPQTPPSSDGPAPSGGGVASKTATSTGLTKTKKKASDQRKAKRAKPSSTSSLDPGSGGSGASSGSGTKGSTAGSNAALSGSTQGRGESAATTKSKHPPIAKPRLESGLTGVIIDASTAGALSAEQIARKLAEQDQASARASRGGGHTNIWLGWLLPGSTVALLIAFGGLVEFRPHARYRRLLTS